MAKRAKAGQKTGRPLKTDWWKAVDRYLAGEPVAAVAAACGVSTSSIFHHARMQGRRKRDLGVPTLAKGPPPVLIGPAPHPEVARMEVRCAALAFTFDPDDPAGAADAMLAAVVPTAATGAWKLVDWQMKMAGALQRFAAGQWRARSRAAADGVARAAASETPRPAHVLRDSQRPPAGDWTTWLFLGGRGAGKTLAGAEWLADMAEALGPEGRLALVGPTLHDVREVMIEGVSGLRSLPRWTAATRPAFEAARRRLRFAGGAVAYAFSAEDPDSLRGPQFAAAWADEFCAWPAKGSRGAAETLALLRMGLRLPGPAGASPRLCVTTTPRATRALKTLRQEAGCVETHAPTTANAAHLSEGFVEGLRAVYGGTRREAQELEGQVVDMDGALFTAEMLAGAREAVSAPPDGRTGCGTPSTALRTVQGCGAPSTALRAVQGCGTPSTALRAVPLPQGGRIEGFERLVVAVDPPATAGGDASGLVAAGLRKRPDGRREAVVVADRSIAGLGPDAWARRAVELAREVGATTIVAEVNQGGDMVRQVLRTAGCSIRLREVRATRGKRLRAEPVAALYEQGRVRHAGAFPELEEELMALGGEGEGSLDRADALVWAVTDLLVDPPGPGPRIRQG
ncbi:DNA-packaging protein [Brevundimonas sp.]|uniref:DNA-packaging protein n=1 Tax=Brevundimonas sp. TaxID=1871086 RepID=UPI0035B4EBEB